MKGVVLAGGTGSRLFPLTKITNKHLLPIYDKPMIYYPIQTLVDAGIKDILIVTGGQEFRRFSAPAGQRQAVRPEAHQLHLPGRRRRHRRRAGAGRALRRRAEDLRHPGRQHHRGQHPGGGRPVSASRPQGAQILLKEVPDAERFGVAEISGDRIVGIEEKPQKPKSNLRRDGHLHVRRDASSTRSRRWCPPGRGELEITDVNNAYIREGTMTFSYLDGWWTDAGTFESLLRAGESGGAIGRGQVARRRRKWRNASDGASADGLAAGAAGSRVRRARPGASRVREGHRLGHPLARFAAI